MKKLLIFLITITLCLSFGFSAFAEDGEAPAREEIVDASCPRLMVTSYKLDGGSLSPSKEKALSITFKNYSRTKALKNIKLSVADESGEIETKGMPTKYVDRIGAGSTYTWKLVLKAASTAQIGEHKLSVSSEYEDRYYNSYAGNDVIGIKVRQSVGLDYDGLILSPKLVQGDTETLTVNLMNTGKTDLRNCKVEFDVKGLATGGAMFVGEIPAGESKDSSVNLRVSTDLLGETTGNATISYEDAYGKKYTKTAELSTIIEEKVETVEIEDEEEKAKYPLWWLFLIVGAVVGGGVGCSIPIAVNNSKKRKEDELRL